MYRLRETHNLKAQARSFQSGEGKKKKKGKRAKKTEKQQIRIDFVDHK
jgi:hypothetical protein